MSGITFEGVSRTFDCVFSRFSYRFCTFHRRVYSGLDALFSGFPSSTQGTSDSSPCLCRR